MKKLLLTLLSIVLIGPSLIYGASQNAAIDKDKVRDDTRTSVNWKTTRTGEYDMPIVAAVNLDGTPISLSAGDLTISDITIADGGMATLGAKADSAATTDTGTFTQIALTKRGLQSLTSIGTALASVNTSLDNIESYDSRLLSSAIGVAAGDPAATTAFVIGGQYRATPQTFANLQQGALGLNVNGALLIDGSAVIQPVSGTITANLGTLNGAATSAKQDTGNTSLGTIATNTTSIATSAKQDTGNTSLASIDTSASRLLSSASGVAAASPLATTALIAGGQYRSSPQTFTNLQQGSLGLNVNGALLTDGSAVTQPTNVSQINGATPLMGAGNTGTGSQRVTVATDQATLPVAIKSNLGAANIAVANTTAATSEATLVIARATRRKCTIKNKDSSITVYVGPATTSSSAGFEVKAGESVVVTWVGLVQVISASGSPVVNTIDEYD